jgi:hypothetical protein
MRQNSYLYFPTSVQIKISRLYLPAKITAPEIFADVSRLPPPFTATLQYKFYIIIINTKFLFLWYENSDIIKVREEFF